jgi:hypothetical protein
MKMKLQYILTALLPFLGTSCIKTPPLTGSASLTIVNTVVGTDVLVSVFGSPTPRTWFAAATPFNYGSFEPWAGYQSNQLTGFTGIQQVYLYQIEDTLPHSTPLFGLTLSIPLFSMHTLFLTGTTTSPDILFTADTLPYYSPSDSSLGVRFVNLSPGSAPVSVDIQGGPNGSEVKSLPYKGTSSFRTYSATASDSTLAFEFRDVATGNLLASYTIDVSDSSYSGGYSETEVTNIYRYRNFTLALYGLPAAAPNAGSWPQSALLINNY